MDIILTIMGFIVTGAFGLIGWVMKLIFDKFKEQGEEIEIVQKNLSDHRLHVAENFAAKVDIKDMENKLVGHLIRIEDKLDKKVDK